VCHSGGKFGKQMHNHLFFIKIKGGKTLEEKKKKGGDRFFAPEKTTIMSYKGIFYDIFVYEYA
jgi:hypothetical protein